LSSASTNSASTKMLCYHVRDRHVTERGVVTMGVQQSIPAVYEDGVFKPLEPVYGVTEHAQVHLIIQTEEAMAQRIAESEHLARESLEGLTAEQLAIIADAALDQEHFFDRPQ
jgi:predicted DNA-binding antitoxin AbrB/MazE fold protein